MHELLYSGVLEFLDCNEELNSHIAFYPSDLKHENKEYPYTHCALSNTAIYGVVSSWIPYPDYN